MPKPFTAEELALLEMKPAGLSPILKKERDRLKARIYVAKNREKQRTEMGNDNYKAMRVEKMKVYRDEKKTEYLQAVEKTTTNPKEKQTIIKSIQTIEKKRKDSVATLRDKSTRDSKPVERLKIIQDAPKVITKKEQGDKDKTPQWLSRLIKNKPNFKINDKDYVKERSYDNPVIEKMIIIIEKVVKDVEGKTLSVDMKSKITSVFRGLNIEEGTYRGSLAIFRKEMPFLDINRIDTFINKVSSYYYEQGRKLNNSNINTIKTNLNPFVNLLSRIDSYKKQHQILTKFNVSLNNIYTEQRSDNIVSDEDLQKITAMKEFWNYSDVNKTKELIDNANLSLREQAIASLFLLMPPRRLDHQHVILTKKGLDADSLNALKTEVSDKNYLVMDGTTPIKWIYKNFKTAKKGGKTKYEVLGVQTFDVYPAVGKYLSKYITTNNLKLGDYLFGTLKEARTKLDQGNYSDLIKTIMLKIFKINDITSTVLRTAGAMWNQQTPNRSNREKEDFSFAMAHSEKTNQLYNKILPTKNETTEDKREAQVKKGNKIPIMKQQPTVVENKPKPKVILKPVEKVGNVRRSVRNKKKK